MTTRRDPAPGVDAPRVISLFSGAGGLDYGLEAAGFHTAVAVDVDPDACASLRASRSWAVLESCIHRVDPKRLLALGSLRRGEAALLAGGPPCQPFSKSGFWKLGETRRLDDPRARTLNAYLDIVEGTLPQSFLLENVHGLAYRGADEGLKLLLEGVDGINARCGTRYTPRTMVIDAAAFGVPQHRERFVLVATRDGQSFAPPPATHGPGLVPYRTCWDALADLPEDPGMPELAIGGQWADLLPSIPEGANYLWHTERGGGKPLFGWRRKYWSFLLKLAKARPSWTIQARPGSACGPFHWTSRRLSPGEIARLQTFPDDVTIASGARTAEGRLVSAQRQLGNAVPSLLGEVLGRAIARALGIKAPEGPLLLMPPTRTPVPPPERRRPVPRRYYHLEGHHAAHPGEGRGPGARARASP